MKAINPIIMLSIAALSLTTAGALAADRRPMSGAYQVVTADCLPSQLMAGNRVAVDSTQDAFRISSHGQEVIQLSVGVTHDFCMGDCENYFSTFYSQDGTVISQVRLMANTIGALPDFAGAIIVKYAKGQLSISNSDAFQFKPAETKTCVLKSL